MHDNKITYGFIGCGNMGSCLIGGLIKNGCNPIDIIGCDTNQQALDAIQTSLGIRVNSDAQSMLSEVDVIVLSIKPQRMESVLKTLANSSLDINPLFISVAAGVTLATLLNWIGGKQSIIRVMPNTPSLLGAGMSGLCANEYVTEEQKHLANTMMSAVGITIWVNDESKMDVVTAISGSGPAYFFRIMEVMEQTAIELGLSKEQAKKLVQQTAYGAALMVKESGKSPTILREQVTSPGGTTEYALTRMNNNGIEELLSTALKAARDRSIEIGKQLGDE